MSKCNTLDLMTLNTLIKIIDEYKELEDDMQYFQGKCNNELTLEEKEKLFRYSQLDEIEFLTRDEDEK